MPALEIGTRVKVYYNLRLHCLSVLTYRKEVRRWLLHSHLHNLALRDVEFRVSEAGRQRVLAERQKNVHAYVVGFVTEPRFIGSNWRTAIYNPYFDGAFLSQGIPVYKAEFAQFEHSRLFLP